MPKVTFEREGITVEARAGQTVLEVAEQAGIDVFRGMWPELHCGSAAKGWCNRCKIWVKPSTSGAVNAPTAVERRPRLLTARVSGTMRLACQVQVSGDVEVHTRSGGAPVRTNMVWEEVPGPTKWKERWEKRHEKGGGEEEADEAAADAE
jgi:ferredoxin